MSKCNNACTLDLVLLIRNVFYDIFKANKKRSYLLSGLGLSPRQAGVLSAGMLLPAKVSTAQKSGTE